MTRFYRPPTDLEYYDDERELTIVIECDRHTILGVHAFDADDEQVDLTQQEQWRWIAMAEDDLLNMAADAADYALCLRRDA